MEQLVWNGQDLLWKCWTSVDLFLHETHKIKKMRHTMLKTKTWNEVLHSPLSVALKPL